MLNVFIYIWLELKQWALKGQFIYFTKKKGRWFLIFWLGALFWTRNKRRTRLQQFGVELFPLSTQQHWTVFTKKMFFLPVGARGPKQTHSTATFLKSLKVEVKTKYEQNVDNSMNLFFLQTVDMLKLYISNSLRLSLMSLLPDKYISASKILQMWRYWQESSSKPAPTSPWLRDR